MTRLHNFGKIALNRQMVMLTVILVIAATNIKAQDSTNTTTTQHLPSPRGALIRSAIIPGWGQLYNHKFVKAIGFFGLESFFVYKYYDLNKQLAYISGDRRSGLKYDRNTWAWRFLAGYVINLADAYVDAQLAGFPKNDSLDLNFMPTRKGWLFSFQFSL